MKSLSPGLGFYDTKKEVQNKTSSSQLSANAVPDFLLKDDWDYQQQETYKNILSTLENPWLGEQEFLNNPLPPPPSSLDHGLSKSSPSSLKKTSHLQKSSLKTLNSSYVLPVKSMCIDGMLAACLFFPPLLCFMWFSYANPFLVVSELYGLIVVAFLFFAGLYCLIFRLFYLETYGEKKAGYRLCPSHLLAKTVPSPSPEWERGRAVNTHPAQNPVSPKDLDEVHPLLLFWRWVVMIATGFVVLPLLSWFLKKDLAGKLTGLYVQKLPNS